MQETTTMQVTDLVREARESITVQRVFAPPHEVGGTTVIATARISGGAGGGGGTGKDGDGGEGGGFGVGARPAGVYVVRDGHVSWRPAVDVNHLVSAVATVLVVGMLTRATTRRARYRAAAR